MGRTVSLAVVGAGLMGRQHVGAIALLDDVRLASVIDPSDAAKDYAATLGVAWHADLDRMMAEDPPDGIILATPNQMHVENGLACISAGIPTLVEKPIATDGRAAERLVDAAEAASVPLLVGHHRRFNQVIRAAHEKVTGGALGRIVAVHGICWLFKPDDYFETEWRRGAGAGPAFINLIHDVDLLRYLCGEITSVFASESRSVRGHDAEETIVVVLRFESGALGTLTGSDTIVSPWSWELTASENPAYPVTDGACYLIGGTHGSLELPNAAVWSNAAQRGWWEPIHRRAVVSDGDPPLVLQICHFCRVIRGEEAPLVSGREGLKSLRVIEAIKRSARLGEMVSLS